MALRGGTRLAQQSSSTKLLTSFLRSANSSRCMSSAAAGDGGDKPYVIGHSLTDPAYEPNSYVVGWCKVDNRLDPASCFNSLKEQRFQASGFKCRLATLQREPGQAPVQAGVGAGCGDAQGKAAQGDIHQLDAVLKAFGFRLLQRTSLSILWFFSNINLRPPYNEDTNRGKAVRVDIRLTLG